MRAMYTKMSSRVLRYYRATDFKSTPHRPLTSATASARSSSSSHHDESPLPPVEIPRFIQRTDEPVDVIRARLLYQSRKRGMLENDLILSTFAAKYLSTFTLQELHEYDRLINLPSNDWDIYYWATGVRPIPPEFDTKIMNLLVEHAKNTKGEKRLRQPDLY